MGSGRALEHNVGDSVGPCCSGHVLGSTNVHKKAAPLFSVRPPSPLAEVAIICPLPGLHSITRYTSSLCFWVLQPAWAGYKAVLCDLLVGLGLCTLFLFQLLQRHSVFVVSIYSMKMENIVEK